MKQLLLMMEDEGHKIKNVLQSWQGQPGDNKHLIALRAAWQKQPEGAASGAHTAQELEEIKTECATDLLFSKRAMLSVVHQNPGVGSLDGRFDRCDRACLAEREGRKEKWWFTLLLGVLRGLPW